MKAQLTYSEIIEKNEIANTWILFQLAEKVKSHKDIFLRNELARSISLLKAINQLYHSGEVNSGWVLNRCLLDRLVYVFYFSDDAIFNCFDDWCYIKIFEYRNNISSYNKYETGKPKGNIQHNKEESKKYNELKIKKIAWKKPDPRKILNERGFDFLYKFGYDYASGHTHPLVDDGDFEFYALTKLEPNPYKGMDHEILIINSILIFTLIQQEIYNQLPFKFRGILTSFIEETRKAITKEQNEFYNVFNRIIIYITDKVSLFEK